MTVNAHAEGAEAEAALAVASYQQALRAIEHRRAGLAVMLLERSEALAAEATPKLERARGRGDSAQNRSVERLLTQLSAARRSMKQFACERSGISHASTMSLADVARRASDSPIRTWGRAIAMACLVGWPIIWLQRPDVALFFTAPTVAAFIYFSRHRRHSTGVALGLLMLWAVLFGAAGLWVVYAFSQGRWCG